MPVLYILNGLKSSADLNQGRVRFSSNHATLNAYYYILQGGKYFLVTVTARRITR